MADINEVFGEYDPNQPIVSIDTDKMRALLQALADLPTKLPKGVAEGLYDTYQFYKNQIPVINAESPEDAIKEAALWFIPWTGTKEFGHAVGPRQAVRTNKSGKPNLDDLHNYVSGKESQLQGVRNDIYSKEPEGRVNNANAQVELTQGALNWAMNDLQELKKLPPSIERDNRIKYLEDKVKRFNEIILNAKNEITNAALDQLDYQGRTTKDFDSKYKSLNDDYAHPEESYVYKQIINEYGPKRGPKYWKEYRKYIDE